METDPALIQDAADAKIPGMDTRDVQPISMTGQPKKRPPARPDSVELHSSSSGLWLDQAS